MTAKTGTFLVTHATAESAVLADVTDGQVHTLSTNPGVERYDALVATVEPEPPMEVTWTVVDVERQWSLAVEEGEESPTTRSRTLAADQAVGEVSRMERAGIGEVHVLTVPPERTEAAVQDVLDDEGVLRRAARLGVDRVEVRAADGVVAVRYLP